MTRLINLKSAASDSNTIISPRLGVAIGSSEISVKGKRTS